MNAYSLRKQNFAFSLRQTNRFAFGDLVAYSGELYYWEPRDHEFGFLYAREKDLGDWSKRLMAVEAKACDRLDQDRRFRVIRRRIVQPINLDRQEISARLRMRFLYGKRYLKALRTEMSFYGVKRGLHRVYLAEMTLTRLTSRKIQVIRSLAAHSLKHKCFLLISDRPTRANYQADPRLFSELAPYLGRHNHCALFSWGEGPSAMQLAALIGMLCGTVSHENLAVSKGLFVL